MGASRTATRINDFLGSAHVFASAVNMVVEKKLLREVAGPDLTFSQLKLLKLVAYTDAHTIGDVAVFLGVSDAAASKAVDKLVRRRLLRRSEEVADRRASHLSLTRPSRRLLAAYEAAKNRKLARLFGNFSPAELQQTEDLLDRLSAGLVGHNTVSGELCLQCGIYFRDQCLLRELVERPCFYQQHKSRADGRPTQGSNGVGIRNR